jgi:putative toxin-antitoxin system antitoxin component (TIGR02293 family)
MAKCRIIDGIMPRPITTVPPLQPVTTTRQVGKLLGIESSVSSETELAFIVEGGLEVDILERLIDVGFERRELFDLVIPQRTLTHRKSKGEPLSAEESDRAVRLARISTLAARVFGSRDKAWTWLRKPTRTFEAKAPIELLATETGARAVEEELYRIDEGMFA